MKILHGFTGSVATTLLNKFRHEYYSDKDFSNKFIFTQSSQNFVKLEDCWFGEDEFFDDSEEWRIYRQKQKVLHIEFVKWADVFVIAPLSANTLAKIANGICDNLLTCVARAWDFEKPFVVAPAMNCNMMSHPIYKEHIDKIKSWGIKVVEPQSKKLFCGDYGNGAMANIDDIIKEIKI
jgi:phosphopantothenoylcysteine decarboxylase